VNSGLHRTYTHLALLVFCNLIWASQFVMVKLVQRQLGPLAATLLPMTLATLLLVPFVWHERRGRAAGAPRAFSWRVAGQFALLGVLGQVFAQLFITWGMRHASASNAALLFLMLPVITAVMARAILGEHMTKIRWASFALAIVGAFFCSGVDWSAVSMANEAALGTGLVLLSICGSAFYNVYSKRLLTNYSELEVLLYSYFAVIACLVPLAWVLEPATFTQWPRFTLTTLAGIGVLAVFQYCLSMVAFLAVLKRIDASQASIGNYLIPFFGLLIAAIFLDERLQWPVIAGGVLVLAATVLATLGERRT
jgi:drug/metabolite transporter (DMT)-like permease